MKKLKILHKRDINGGPVSGQHVNLLHQKMTADDDDERQRLLWLHTRLSQSLGKLLGLYHKLQSESVRNKHTFGSDV